MIVSFKFLVDLCLTVSMTDLIVLVLMVFKTKVFLKSHITQDVAKIQPATQLVIHT